MDAGHMLFDCVALFIALFAEVISQWDANQSFSYGYVYYTNVKHFLTIFQAMEECKCCQDL
jgi:Co/Zn/Cd efflux system component